jgi:hypothetical protein
MEERGERLRRAVKRWRLAKWASFVLLAAAILLALNAAVGRLQATVNMIDRGTAGDADYERMSERASFQTILGLSTGCAAIVGYMVCVVLHQRAKSAEKELREEQRQTTLAALGADESDL